MTRASNDLSILLENLSVLYKTHGINYNVKQYYNVLIRIIAPFQLLSHYHIVDNSSLLIKINPNPNSNYMSHQPPPPPLKTNATNLNNYVNPTNIQPVKKEVQQNLSQISYPLRNLKSSWPKTSLNYHTFNNLQKPPPAKRGRKPFALSMEMRRNSYGFDQYNRNYLNQTRVDFAMEQVVNQWVKNQTKFGDKLQMVDICRFAKHISKNANFLASSGWCANFLNRHPDLKKHIKRKKWKKMLRNTMYQGTYGQQQGVKSQYQNIQQRKHLQLQYGPKDYSKDQVQQDKMKQNKRFRMQNNEMTIQYPRVNEENSSKEYSSQYESQLDEQNGQIGGNDQQKHENQQRKIIGQGHSRKQNKDPQAHGNYDEQQGSLDEDEDDEEDEQNQQQH